jgi:hypothetical protein
MERLAAAVIQPSNTGCSAERPDNFASEDEMAEGKTTVDHKKIRKWAEERGGVPSTVKGTGGKKDAGILRLDFKPDDEGLAEISWEEFFEKFDNSNLAFLYQDKTQAGRVSRFHKFIERPTRRGAAAAARTATARRPAAKRTSSAKPAAKTASKAKPAAKAKAAPPRKTASKKR